MQIGIIGAGAWGMALATVAARNGHKVSIWDPAREIVDTVNREHRHPFALPGITLDPKIIGKERLEEVAIERILLLAVPAQSMRSALNLVSPHITGDTIVVVCAKGIEIETGALMSDLVTALIPHAGVAVISGPTFADEVARGLPTAVTLASSDSSIGHNIAAILGYRNFRTYLTDDIIGAQVAGAVKNVLAIACGIADGRSFGDNARSAVITRGAAEIGRLTIALGGKSETIMSLSGIGDLVLTCTSQQSRNYSLGREIATSKSVADAIKRCSSTVEGVPTAASVANLSLRHGISMPITMAVNAILHDGVDIDAEITGLLVRPPGPEVFGWETTG